MTSLRQIEANRRNALKSTGPSSAEGKQQSRLNAVRHSLTAETVIGALEDVEHYKAFEPDDYDVESAVGWSWCCGSLAGCGGCAAPPPWKRPVPHPGRTTAGIPGETPKLRQARVSRSTRWTDRLGRLRSRTTRQSAKPESGYIRLRVNSADPSVDFASCFLTLANLPTMRSTVLAVTKPSFGVKPSQIVFTLHALGRRRPQDRGRHFQFRNHYQR